MQGPTFVITAGDIFNFKKSLQMLRDLKLEHHGAPMIANILRNPRININIVSKIQANHRRRSLPLAVKQRSNCWDSLLAPQTSAWNTMPLWWSWIVASFFKVDRWRIWLDIRDRCWGISRRLDHIVRVEEAARLGGFDVVRSCCQTGTSVRAHDDHLFSGVPPLSIPLLPRLSEGIRLAAKLQHRSSGPPNSL